MSDALLWVIFICLFAGAYVLGMRRLEKHEKMVRDGIKLRMLREEIGLDAALYAQQQLSAGHSWAKIARDIEDHWGDL